jgi:hypothetical protein
MCLGAALVSLQIMRQAFVKVREIAIARNFRALWLAMKVRRFGACCFEHGAKERAPRSDVQTPIDHRLIHGV